MSGAGKQRQVGEDEKCRCCSLACDELYRAFKAAGFYPAGHPRRFASLQAAHAALLVCVRDQELVLVTSRAGFVSSDGGAAITPGPLSRAIAHEFFIRRIRRLTFLPDVSLADFSSLLELLTMDPQEIQSGGGVEVLMGQRRIATIWANELDLSVILQKRKELEAAASGSELSVATAVSQVSESGGLTAAMPVVHEQAPPELADIIARMEQEDDNEKYRQLARSLVDCCEVLRSAGDYESLFPALSFLVRQGNDEGISVGRRGYALLALDQVADEQVIEYLVQGLVEKNTEVKEQLHPIFRQLGAKTVPLLVARLAVAESKVARKNLSAALVAVGEEAVASLAGQLTDERWYVVRNVAAILGEIGDVTCVGQLAQCLAHEDERVCKEALRSLGRIGGHEAEAEILRVLGAGEPGLKRQAAISLGLMRSEASIATLCAVVGRRDIFLRSFQLKMDAIQALGRIGSVRALPCLVGILQQRHWLASRRWRELKVAVAVVLGQLGDATTLFPLLALAARGGRLGQACADAAESVRMRLDNRRE